MRRLFSLAGRRAAKSDRSTFFRTHWTRVRNNLCQQPRSLSTLHTSNILGISKAPGCYLQLESVEKLEISGIESSKDYPYPIIPREATGDTTLFPEPFEQYQRTSTSEMS
ncbi:hypothetical protein NPIL_68551 [Nephila pilipes]|uniref:Uncharacterized protein n=1 Tax=Nephila pilipes TaxID=299642 RepID=A0A8X6PU45_NEPPI|nr:hypothetical protein NPIL_322131 [Nephila pilipes]GFT89603.1 hypothetical protein NPIL_68551 [Nephila pilipes]